MWTENFHKISKMIFLVNRPYKMVLIKSVFKNILKDKLYIYMFVCVYVYVCVCVYIYIPIFAFLTLMHHKLHFQVLIRDVGSCSSISWIKHFPVLLFCPLLHCREMITPLFLTSLYQGVFKFKHWNL